MKVHHALPARAPERAFVVAVGFFDGFHRGHQAIVREALRLRRAGERTAVLTFREHPTAFLRPGQEPPMIATLEERVNAFARAGIDEAFVLPFDASVASLSPAEFLDETLVARLGARAMVVGANFRFGHKRAGDVAFARAHLAERGRSVVGVPNMLDGGERVSSTRDSRRDSGRRARHRGPAARGAVHRARHRSVRGRARARPRLSHGERRRRAAEITAARRRVPDHRAARRPRLLGLVSIGTNPTFDGTARTVEAWLLDFNGALYGEELALRDFRFLRAQRRFDSVDELVAQMRDDASEVRFPTVA